ncbi:phage tail sheath C-terminal domain-containing protein [Paucisalibacillus globulus]|uniref:phage tail sheath C-terminal domain-containing protein n=1 Tax=Paucisalibacillus globulus TaxID=351095 RepID=UPI0020D04935|nr:phage tail sheath C-terminal domain-containing protein [Paucisalibacillus globulus]
MLGGGTFLTQNKVLPGTYQNFISAARAFANLSARGYVALPMVLDWGPDEQVFTVSLEALQKNLENNSRKVFGYEYTHPKLKGIRDVFKSAHTAFIYKINEGAVAASNTFATARYKGVRGNDLKTVISANVDEPANFDVKTFLGTTLVDEQLNVVDAAGLVDNDYVIWKDEAILAATAGTNFTLGSNGTAPTGTPHQTALDELEAYGFNTLACLSSEQPIKDLYIAYTKRMRDEVGAKFQLVGHKLGAADHEGIIDVQNDAIGESEEVFGAVYWTVGAQAGVAVNESNTNDLYDGEYTLDLSETKTTSQLKELLKAGKYVFHRNGAEIYVLEDVNTFTSFTPEKNEDFSMNQVIRVLDQIAIDTAQLFNTRYLGKVPNDAAGRITFWKDIIKHREEMQRLRAIEDYDKEALTIEQGDSKKSVVANEVVNVTVAMSQLYITTVVA